MNKTEKRIHILCLLEQPIHKINKVGVVYRLRITSYNVIDYVVIKPKATIKD